MADIRNNDPLYFESPQQAVEKIKELLAKEDWHTLARYYDLSNSNILFSQLTSGEYFIRTQEPDVKHPAANWRYKHPFDPAFEYDSYIEQDNNVIQVTMRIIIDDGYDEPVVGIHTFEMIKNDNKYQLIP